MKTAKEHFETLPTLIEVRALNSATNHSEKYNSLKEALYPLTKHDSKEGVLYWQFVYNGIKAMAQIKEIEETIYIWNQGDVADTIAISQIERTIE